LGSHGAGFGLNFAWVLLAAAIVAGNTNFFLADLTVPQSFLGTLFIKLTAIHIVITAAQVLLYAYALKKLSRLGDIKYYPVMRFLNLLISMWVKILATEAVLSWSSKWSKYNDEAFRDRSIQRSKETYASEHRSELSSGSRNEGEYFNWQETFYCRLISLYVGLVKILALLHDNL
jgi:hypothetical protein